jgi:hypothetical protein
MLDSHVFDAEKVGETPMDISPGGRRHHTLDPRRDGAGGSGERRALDVLVMGRST